jgi:hypothetical protein
MKLNENITLKKENGIEYLEFNKLKELGVKNAYTLKENGIDFTTGSEFENESYIKICDALKISKDKILLPKQTHTDTVKCVNSKTKSTELLETDGLITDEKDIALVTKNADCILFVFYDPVRKVLANCHSGWRGTFKKIAEKTVRKMINLYGCNAKDILCFISPSIRKCHFEVDEDVAILCKGIFDFTLKTHEFIEKGKVKEGKQKYYIDTVLINKILLKGIGLLEENIYDSELCSVCNADKISSSRVEGKNFTRAIFIASM